MWMFCRDGFYSAVAHRQREGWMVVRARCRADMERLCDAAELPREHAQHTPEGDYLWRVEMEKVRWVAFVSRVAQEIDYPNFKDAVHGDLARDTAYTHVWAAMHKFQGIAG